MQTLILTQHAQKRCAQRGICPDHLGYAVRYGKCLHRQGYLFFILRNKDIPSKIEPHARGRIKNLVVVTRSATPDVVVTAYRNARALKHIKRKTQTLL